MNFDRKPLKKTPQEEELDNLMDEYENVFGEPYVFSIGFPMDADEVKTDILNCLKTGKKQVLPEYNTDYKY